MHVFFRWSLKFCAVFSYTGRRMGIILKWLTCQVHDLCEPDDSEQCKSAAAELLERPPSSGPERRLHPNVAFSYSRRNIAYLIQQEPVPFPLWSLSHGSSWKLHFSVSCFCAVYFLFIHPSLHSFHSVSIYHIALFRVVNPIRLQCSLFYEATVGPSIKYACLTS